MSFIDFAKSECQSSIIASVISTLVNSDNFSPIIEDLIPVSLFNNTVSAFLKRIFLVSFLVFLFLSIAFFFSCSYLSLSTGSHFANLPQKEYFTELYLAATPIFFFTKKYRYSFCLSLERKKKSNKDIVDKIKEKKKKEEQEENFNDEDNEDNENQEETNINFKEEFSKTIEDDKRN